MSGEGKVVCVTGGSGYIASWLVKLLLQRGYTVKATLRDPHDTKKTEHLLGLDGAKERLHLVKAELLEEGCFDSVVDGCHGVFHTASPVSFSPSDPQVELIEPAVNGTLNVLKSCAKTSSVKRVVLTSSIATILYNGEPLTLQVLLDKTWQSNVGYSQRSKLYYTASKILAEESALEFSKQHGIDLVVMNPGLVIGPLLQPTLNFSVEVILKMINGDIVFPGRDYRFVDVRDVASAHIQAFEIDSACGRYYLVAQVLALSEVLQILHQQFPALQLLPRSGENSSNSGGPRCQAPEEKAKTLGINFIPVEVSLKDTVESLKQKNFL